VHLEIRVQEQGAVLKDGAIPPSLRRSDEFLPCDQNGRHPRQLKTRLAVPRPAVNSVGLAEFRSNTQTPQAGDEPLTDQSKAVTHR